MVLDEPMPGPTGDEAIHAISWGPTELAFYAEDDDPDEDAPRKEDGILVVMWNDANRSESYFHKLTSDNLLQGIDAAGKARARRRLREECQGFLPVSFIPLYLNNLLHYPAYRDNEIDKLDRDTYKAARIAALARIVCGIWNLMDQTLPRPYTEHEEPHIRRTFALRARRAGIPPRVTVVKLRRYSTSDETGTGRPLDHRVPVRPHTRHYWVRDPDTGDLVKEKRKIALHYRGPEDAPIVVTDKVYSLQR
jgi:hypothetical protein